MKNWLGLESHPTDQWLYWKTKEKEMREVRAAWDKITSKLSPTDCKELEELISTFRSHAVNSYEFDLHD